MAYLYNACQGSPGQPGATPARDVDEQNQLEQLDEITEQTWTPVEPDLLSQIDWHTLDVVVALAERRVPEVAASLDGPSTTGSRTIWR